MGEGLKRAIAAAKATRQKDKLCPGCGQPMLPKGVKKMPNEYDHAQGCPNDPKKQVENQTKEG